MREGPHKSSRKSTLAGAVALSEKVYGYGFIEKLFCADLPKGMTGERGRSGGL